MERSGFIVFDTVVGRCGLAWNERGIVGVGLPERSERSLRDRLARRAGPGSSSSSTDFKPATVPDEVVAARDAIVTLVATGRGDLSAIELDLTDIGEFEAAVYAVTRAIPPGSVLTYGAVAERIGAPGAAQAVGGALGRNPFPIVVPCHRVVAAHGKLGGFSATGGATTKRRLLEIEGAPIERTLFDV